MRAVQATISNKINKDFLPIDKILKVVVEKMVEFGKKVDLLKPIDVDSIEIKKDSYFPNAYIINLHLASKPGHIWQDIFEREWKSSRHLWDRKIFVVGDKLRLITMPYQIEEKLDWVQRVIDVTNKKVEEYNQEAQVAELKAVKEKKREKEIEAHDEFIKKIRKALKKKFQEIEI